MTRVTRWSTRTRTANGGSLDQQQITFKTDGSSSSLLSRSPSEAADDDIVNGDAAGRSRQVRSEDTVKQSAMRSLGKGLAHEAAGSA